MSTSGVGTQSRYLINGLVATGKYSFRVFGGAVRHEDYKTITVNPDFIIKPTNGFGDINSLRQVLAQEKPDVLLLFTDPRFFIYCFEAEDEIHQVCPIAYNHLWDNPPRPEFNKVLYESTDLINCINYPTYEMVSSWFPEKTNYIPHAVPTDVFFPLPPAEVTRLKTQILGKDRADHFIVTFVSRNARRKMPGDTLSAFKLFLEDLERQHGHKKATLMMHTDPLDPEGPNLHQVIDMLKIKDSVVFSKDRVGFPEMNSLYNISDTIVNNSANEGYGLSVLEAKMAGKPVIAIKTGGLTRQVEDHVTGEQYGVALTPEVKCLVGNQMTAYIYEDFVSHKTLSEAYMKMYEVGPEERTRIGLRAMEHARREYNIKFLIERWDQTLSDLVDNWRNNRPKTWEKIEL